MSSTYISCTETAKIIRAELKKAFPGMKFSVRSRSYAGGSSIDVEWQDGPSEPSVEKIVKRFQGSTFDGMIDLRSYVDTEWNGEMVHFSPDHVTCRRNMSRSYVEAVVAQYRKRYGCTARIEVTGNEKNAWINTHMDYSTEHWLRQILHDTDAKDMDRCYEAEEEREAQRIAEWEAGAAERERQAQEERKRYAAEEQARKERERIEAERRRREQEEQARRQQAQRQRDGLREAQRAVLASPYTARAYLGLPLMCTDRASILEAFRKKVKDAADGKGGFDGDMDFLVKVKERALS